MFRKNIYNPEYYLTRRRLHRSKLKLSALMIATAVSSQTIAEEVTFTSVAQHDGIVVESPALNNTGGFAQANRSGPTAMGMGDLNDNRQVKMFLSFDTSSLPQEVAITSATVRLKYSVTFGSSPYEVLGPCILDIKSGGFNDNTALESVDFQADATATAVGTLSAVSVGGEWTEASISSLGLDAINGDGYTQFRAYCTLPDNANSAQDIANYYSGEDVEFKPELVVNYEESVPETEHSIARIWSEELLASIRKDFARPTVHARNLYHISAAMWDAWAAYDETVGQVLHHEKISGETDIESAREEAISYAAYRLLAYRFAGSPGATERLPAFDAKMAELGYDIDFTSTEGDSPAALGNRIAESIIEFGLNDYSNEQNNFGNNYYEPVNPPLFPDFPGNPDLVDPDRWQPLSLQFFIDQSGNLVPGGSLDFLSPEWGHVTPFALQDEDLTIYSRDGHDYYVYHDPGSPPLFGTEAYRDGYQQVLEWSGELDPADGIMIDISPASRGNNTLGTNDGHGRDINPATGLPYEEQLVPAGDYYRVLAEFWADGPDSETPPGHWFAVANHVMDDPNHVNQFGGTGEILDALEYDLKLYLVLGGAMHDSAISAWGVKGWYDYIRPVSAIRYMCDLGQSSDPDGPSYDPGGIALSDQVKVITEDTIVPGGMFEHLAGENGENVGKIAAYAWKGPDYIEDPDTDTAGVDWILCENWWPYQRPSFVTPPFAGFVSGHSTFSRAAAEVMTMVTGDEYFPGGMGVFDAPQNEFLVFEEGPSQHVQLQWATYRDASDETSISRIYGGIHPTADDIPGRLMGAEIGPDAFHYAVRYFDGELGILPTVNVLASLDGRVFQPGERIFLGATAFDSNGAELSGDIVWTSSVDGILGTGSRLLIASLSSGVHTITATVTDSNGQTTEVSFEIAIGDQPPMVDILGPVDDARITFGDELVFSAIAEDFEGGDISFAVSWSSDIDGLFGVGETLSVTTLSPGVHEITATVEDVDGYVATDTTTITVYGVLDTVSEDIVFTSTATEDGFVVESGEMTEVGGDAISFLNGGGALRLGDNANDQQIKLFASFLLDMPAGTPITAANLVLKRGGGIGASPLTVLGPCTVDFHSSGFSDNPLLQSTDFEAAATANNVATLALSATGGNTFTAEFDQSGVAAVVPGQTAQVRVACSVDDNDDNTENSLGFYSGENANVSLRPELILTTSSGASNTAPVVTIASPADEARVAMGTMITFDASATDAEDGDLSSTIIWRSSIDGIIGEGSIFISDSLSQGSHVITAEALDGEFIPGRSEITVHVGVDLIPMFTDATVESGLDIIAGAVGVAAGDYDNDGCVDLAVSPRSTNLAALLFHSNCDGTFTDVTSDANMDVVSSSGAGLAWGDLDNDGLLDLYVANQSNATPVSQLWHNQGDGTFVDVSDDVGIPGNTGAIGVTWGDYDNDGDLDIFVAGRYGTNPKDALYQNDGTGHFIDVAPAMGIEGPDDDPQTPTNDARLTYMGAWADFDGDLYPELWLSVDFGDDIYYDNIGGALSDGTLAAGITDTATHAMGLAVGDPNGDGCLDILATNNGSQQSTNPEASFLHQNNCDGTFSVVSEAAGVLHRNVTEWGASFVDFDNDGDEDLSIVAGGISAEEQPNVLYQNVSTQGEALELIDVTEATGAPNDGNSRGAIWFDYDEDGDMDWLVANSDGLLLLRNDGPSGNFLKIKLAGTVSNALGVGARIEVTVDGKTMIRYIQAGTSFASAQELEASFGLGTASSVDSIVVKWPSGVVDTITSVDANSLLLIEEGLYQ